MATTKYKDSGIPWIGMIPEDWSVEPIKHKYKIVAGSTPKSDNIENWDGNISWITPADYKTEQIYVYRGKRNLSQKGYESCSAILLPPGCLIFSKRAPIGLVAINSLELCTNQGCLGCIPNNDVNTKFVYYSTSIFSEQFELYGSGTTFKEISANNFANFRLALPPLPTQQRIADFLDRKCAEIDELSALQETMIAELKRYKQSVITEAVTKGLDKNVKMKDSASRAQKCACTNSAEAQPILERKFNDSGVEWIGEVPEGWEVCRLKDILKRPLQYGANESGIPYNEELPRYVRITDILENSLREDLIKQSLSEEQAAGYILEDNDILFARSGGTVGKAFIYKQKYGRCAFAGYLIKAAIEKGDAQFIYYYTQSHCYEEWKRRIFIQATIQNIGADRYSIMELPIPPLTEQQAIADYLDEKCSEIDELIAIKQQKIEQLKEYKKSVIFEYVTGKKEVL